MLETAQVTYVDSFYDVTITVKQATMRDGTRRGALIAQTEAVGEESESLAVYIFYPNLIAGTVEIESRGERELSLDMTQDEFLDLPEALVDAWHKAVVRLNPQWLPFVGATGEET